MTTELTNYECGNGLVSSFPHFGTCACLSFFLVAYSLENETQALSINY